MKILILGLICLFVFAYCESPADPDVKEVIEKNSPVIEYFMATPSQIDYLQSSILKWKVTNADKIVIDNGIGEVVLEGMKEIAPVETTTYILIATNDDGNIEQLCKVTCKSGYIYEYWDSPSPSLGDYSVHVYGEIKNRGWTPVYNPRVIVKMYLFGELLATEGNKICDKLEPNESTNWEIIFDDSEHYMRNNWSELIPISIYEWD